MKNGLCVVERFVDELLNWSWFTTIFDTRKYTHMSTCF